MVLGRVTAGVEVLTDTGPSLTLHCPVPASPLMKTSGPAVALALPDADTLTVNEPPE